MIRYRAFFVFISLIVNLTAHAEGSTHTEKVNDRSIRLLGRGLQNRRTHETLALACVVENCSKIRFIYFTGNGKDAYLYGYPISITTDGSTPTEVQIKATLKDLFRRFKQDKAFDSEQRTTRFIQYAAGAAGLTILVTASGGVGPTLIALGAFAAGSYLLIILNQTEFTLNPATASFDDVNGWNWSSNAKRISRRNFNYMLRVKNVSDDRFHPDNIQNFRSIE